MIRKIHAYSCFGLGILLFAVAVAAGLHKDFADAVSVGAFGFFAVWWGWPFLQTRSVTKRKPSFFVGGNWNDLKLQGLLFKRHSETTLILIGLSLVPFFALHLHHNILDSMDRNTALNWGANFAPLVAQGQVWRLLTGAFLHYNSDHLVWNMIALLIVGRYVDYCYGKPLLIFIYITTAIWASLASNLIHPAGMSIGASGAIFGLYGAFLATFITDPAAPLRKVRFSNYAMVGIGFHILKSMAEGFMAPGIDNSAHLAGFVSGLAIGSSLVVYRIRYLTLRNAMGGALLACMALLQLTFYRTVPSMESIRETEFANQQWTELAECGLDLSNLLKRLRKRVDWAKLTSNNATVKQEWSSYFRAEFADIDKRLSDMHAANAAIYRSELRLYSVAVRYQTTIEKFFGENEQDRKIAGEQQDEIANEFSETLTEIESTLAQLSAPSPKFASLSGKEYSIQHIGPWILYDLHEQRIVRYFQVQYLTDSLKDQNRIDAEADDLMSSVDLDARDGNFEGISIMAQRCIISNYCLQFGTLYLRTPDGSFVRHKKTPST